MFEDERFPFSGGRLLLRGTNGTGKSRVLAMTLPLLLDGSLSPTRVEPDRDATRQVAWNVLGDDQHSATGYSWLEFGRVDNSVDNGDDNGEHFITLGMGIRAVRGGAMKSWFFVTPRRIDRDLILKTADNVPLTQRALAEALDGKGQVIETATEYRRVVDETLFRLGDRYEPLIDLLLQLRQPKLAEKLDIDQMEKGLRISLPPLRQSLLDDAAEAFRELDEFRTSLACDQQMLSDVRSFMRPYRDHIRRGALRAIKTLTSANSRYETAQRKLRSFGEKLEQQTIERERLGSRKQELHIAIQSDQAAIEELQQSPEMRGAERLDQLRQSVSKLKDRVEAAKKNLQQWDDQLHIAKAQSDQALEVVRATGATALEASEEARRHVAPASLQNRHRQWLGDLLTGDSFDSTQHESYKTVEKKLQQEADRFYRAAERLAELTEEIAEAQSRLSHARREVERGELQVRQRKDQLQSAREHFDTTRDELWQAILAWHESAAILHAFLPTPPDWFDAWQQWVEGSAAAGPSDADPSLPFLQAAASGINRQLADERSSLQTIIETIEAQEITLRHEQSSLRAGDPVLPPSRFLRDQSHRQTLTGAPLWRLIEFQPTIPTAELAGWEAALEDSGLLDAWVTPDGQLVSHDSLTDRVCDVQLLSVDMPMQPESRRLARVVAPDESAITSCGLETGIVERLLDVIGVGEGAGETWVTVDGRWRNGPLAGNWEKEEPQFIGREIRDRFREFRLSRIDARLTTLADQRDLRRAEIEDIDVRQASVEDLLKSFPNTSSLTQASIRVDASLQDVDVATAELIRLQENEVQRREEAQTLVAQREADAGDFGLIGWETRATELQSVIASYRDKVRTLRARVDAFQNATTASSHALQGVDQLSTQYDGSVRQLQDSRTEFAGEQKRIAELESTIGKDAESLIQRLEQRRRQRDSNEGRQNQNDDDLLSVEKSLAVTEKDIQQSQDESEKHDRERHEATEWFSSLHSRELICLADETADPPELPWSMTQAIRLARQLDSAIGDVPIDEDAWNRSQTRIHTAQNELQQTVLTQSEFSISADHLRDGLQVVTLTLQGESLPPRKAVTKLNSEIESRKQILDDREQDVLEKYLLGEVAEGIRVGMQSASELIASMTREVSRRPLRTGMQMRFKWQQAEDGPPGLSEACEVLSTTSATWSADERDQIKRFLQQSIRLQRESEQTESWAEHLAAALDYRLWHRIIIERRSGPDAAWKRLTRRTYGSGSGGEKAIALTLPQLAATAAYYQTADPLAPRFILLDEAFAGVSSDGREGCMELIEAFKLDVVMTSETEWGMYPGVSQLAICQLDRFPEFNAVVNRVFLWNGRELRDAISREDAEEAKTLSLFNDSKDERD